MPTNTPNHGYQLYGQHETGWEHRTDFEKLDADVEIRDTAANRGNYAAKLGAKYLATDTGDVYLGDGTNWNHLGTVGTPGTGTVCNSIAELKTAITNSPGTYTWSEHTYAGDMFVLPPGEYNPAAADLPITIDRPLWIRGGGRRQTIINVPAGYAGAVFHVDFNDYSHMRFSDFAIVGDAGLDEPSRATAGQTGFRLTPYTHNWRLDHILCHGLDLGLITEGDQTAGLPGAWLGRISHSSFRRCNAGVDLYDNAHAVGIIGCSFDNNRDFHVRILASTGVAIHQTQLEEIADYGVRIDWCDGFDIAGCYIEGNKIAGVALQPDTTRTADTNRVTGSIRGSRINADVDGACGVQAGRVRKVTAENNGISGTANTAAFEWTTDYASTETRWDWNRMDNPVQTRTNLLA